MKSHSKFILVVFLVFACQAAPDFRDSDGNAGRWRDFDGKWLIISYWAEWCKPCLEEVPLLNALDNLPQAAVIAISFDQQTADVLRPITEKWNMQYPSAFLTKENPPKWEVPAMLPAAMLRRPDGEIEGPFYGKQAIEKLKARIMQE